MKDIHYSPIGVIRSPFKETKGMPIQPTGAQGIKGIVEIAPDYTDGLKDLEGFSHIFLIYHFHLSQGFSLVVKPYLDDSMRGVFATRAPKRPNALGLSLVRLVAVEGRILHIEDVDVADATPLLDIKPYVPEFDHRKGVTIGWLADKAEKAAETGADERFK